jgi:tripartite ATP-independent transporter DctM subunit
MTMFGAVVAARTGELSSLGSGLRGLGPASVQRALSCVSDAGAALVCGVLCAASAKLVWSEMQAAQELAYGIPLWWVQASMPVGFALLGLHLGGRCGTTLAGRMANAVLCFGAGAALVWKLDGQALPPALGLAVLLALLLAGAPVFSILGGLGLILFWQDSMPLAAVPLSHYQITVHSALPALPLFTLAGLIYARTGAARRLGELFVALFGAGVRGTVIACAVLCSCFTAFTGGSGVTILALGGLLLPLLRDAGYPEQRSISLVTSASALGVLLPPSVPLILYAILARVPIQQMFLAGLIPAAIMVVCLLFAGGYMRRTTDHPPAPSTKTALSPWDALRRAKWELVAAVIAIGALFSGLATPTETAALTAAFALFSQAFIHRELGWRLFAQCMVQCVAIIGGIMLILGMALGLTNYLVDAGIPDAAVDWVQSLFTNKYLFLLALNVVLFLAGALMEIFAAVVFLVPLLLPVAMSYGIDPLHFGILFLANLEMGFLCPPAGMNLYFASSLFGKPVRYIAVSVIPAVLAIFLGTLVISWVPAVATTLPRLFGLP